MTIMQFLRKYKRIIFIVTLIVFVLGVFIGFGGYFFSRGANIDAIALVNGVKITNTKFYRYYRDTVQSLRDKGQDITEDIEKTKQTEVLRDMIQEEVFYQESKKFGVNVPDVELARYIQSFDGFKHNGVFDRNVYFQVLQYRLKTSPAEFEEERKRNIAIAKLRMIVSSSVNLTLPEINLALNQKYKNSIVKDDEKNKFITQLRQEKLMAVFEEWYRSVGRDLKVKEFLSETFKQAK